MNEFALSCGVTNARSSNTDTRIHDTRIRSLVLLGWWEMERQVMIMGMTEILILLGLVLFVSSYSGSDSCVDYGCFWGVGQF